MMRRVLMVLLMLGTAQATWAATASAAGPDALNKAKAQVEEAIAKGETSLGPHEPGTGWTKRHMQQVVTLIEGGQGASHDSAMHLLKNSQGGLKENGAAAVDAALAYLKAAVEHAKKSVSAKSIDETHAEATLATGLLVAARGNADAKSPITGALALAARP